MFPFNLSDRLSTWVTRGLITFISEFFFILIIEADSYAIVVISQLKSSYVLWSWRHCRSAVPNSWAGLSAACFHQPLLGHIQSLQRPGTARDRITSERVLKKQSQRSVETLPHKHWIKCKTSYSTNKTVTHSWKMLSVFYTIYFFFLEWFMTEMSPVLVWWSN